MRSLEEVLILLAVKIKQCTDVTVAEHECNNARCGSLEKEMWRVQKIELTIAKIVTEARECTDVSVVRQKYNDTKEIPEKEIWKARLIEFDNIKAEVKAELKARECTDVTMAIQKYYNASGKIREIWKARLIEFAYPKDIAESSKCTNIKIAEQKYYDVEGIPEILVWKAKWFELAYFKVVSEAPNCTDIKAVEKELNNAPDGSPAEEIWRVRKIEILYDL